MLDFFQIVKGELYRVNENGLKQLDQFEGHPDFYVRKEIEVKEERGRDLYEIYKELLKRFNTKENFI